jgi:signal transduction histidine kinase/serine/threonine protein kinase/CheY-like chemotaxis protein/tetratricopeptide (TPR) repeat protein
MDSGEIAIPDFELIEEIGSDSHSTVYYRANRAGTPFTVKVARQDDENGRERVSQRLHREAALLATFRHPSLPSVVKVGEVRGACYLVMEHVAGRPVSALVAEGPLVEELILTIARSLAGALVEVHRRGLRADVKPRNIVIDAQGGARFVDLGLVLRGDPGPRESDFRDTLGYQSPEQSGMIKRPIDVRSDLYMLGAVLFELAAGRPAFESGDPSELVRLHAVSRPPSLGSLRPNLSPALASIIETLLAKDPDDRYQSAAALLADLDDLPYLDARIQHDGAVRLGTHSAHNALPDSLEDARLVGRGSELVRLDAAWQRACDGKGSLIVVAGEAGSGKSRLVSEFTRRSRSQQGLLLESRCNPDENIPMAPLRSAIDEWMAGGRREDRSTLQELVRAAAQGLSPHVRRLSESLASCLPEQRDGALRDSSDAEFIGALARFMSRLGGPDRPVLWIIEDAAWLDSATLGLLKQLGEWIGAASLLVVICVRAFGESAGVLTGLRHDPAIEWVEIDPLSPSDVEKLVIQELGGRTPPNELINKIQAAGRGNPFAVIQFVTAMIEQGWIVPLDGRLVLNESHRERLDLPGDVTALVKRRITDLSPGARDIVTTAAALGPRFDTRLLMSASGSEDSHVAEALTEALSLHLITSAGIAEFEFVHDQFRDALLDPLSVSAEQAIHGRIAQALDELGGSGPEYVYRLASHYARCGWGQDTLRRRYESGLAAGKLAYASFAAATARAFLADALQCEEIAGLAPDPELHETLGHACNRAGRIGEALSHFDRVLELIEDRNHRLEIHDTIATIHQWRLDFHATLREVSKSFEEIGTVPPSLSISGVARALASWLAFVIGTRTGWGLGGARGQKARDLRALVSAYTNAVNGSVLSGKPVDALIARLRSLLAAHRLGPSRELASTYEQYGFLLSAMGLRRAASRYLKLASELVATLDDPYFAVEIEFMAGFSKDIQGDVQGATQAMQVCLAERGHLLMGSIRDTAISALHSLYVFRGYMEEARDLSRRELRRLLTDETGPTESEWRLWVSLVSLSVFLGDVDEALDYWDRACEEFPRIGQHSGTQYAMNSARMFLCLELPELGDQTDAAIEEHGRLFPEPNHPVYQLDSGFLLVAHLRLKQLETARDGEVERAREALSQAVAHVRKINHHPIHRAHRLAIEGAYERVTGDRDKAIKLLRRAQESADEIDSPWATFEVYLQLARLFAAEGAMNRSRHYAIGAQGIAAQSGWKLRYRRVTSEFKLIELVTAAQRPRSFEVLNLQGQLDALQTMSLASVVTPDPAGQARVALDEIARIFGVERGFLFIAPTPASPLTMLAGRDAEGRELAEPPAGCSELLERVRDRLEPEVLSERQGETAAGSDASSPLRSAIAIPLMLRDRFTGAVYLENRLARGAFLESDVAILRAIANHVAIALERSRAEEEIRLRARQQSAVAELGLRALAEADLSSLMREAALVVVKVWDVGLCEIRELDEDGELLRMSAAAVAAGDPASDDDLPLELDSLPARALRRDGPVTARLADDSTLSAYRERLAGDWDSGASTVLHGRGRAIGVLSVFAEAPRRFAADDLGSLQAVANLLAEARERLRAEEALRASNEQLLHAQKMEAIGRLAGGVAHDFNNTLTIIRGYTDFLLERELDEEVRADLNEVKNAERQAAAITRQLLAFSRRQIFTPRIVDPGGVVLELESMLRRSIGANVGLRFEIESALPSIQVDPAQLQQVIVNLAVNARDAMPNGGELEIGVGVTPDMGQVVISVHDNGIGMSDEVRAHLFEPFYTTKSIEHGTGLGLSIVYGIVEQSGGSINVESELGRGSRFELSFPVATKVERREHEEERPDVARAAGETILIVEDEESVRRMVERLLRQLGYRVVSAGNASEALGLDSDLLGNVDLLITDVVMPGASGPELVEELRRRWPAIPVLYLSGYSEDASLGSKLQEGCTAFLGKPFDHDELAAAVTELLKKRELDRRPPEGSESVPGR